MINQPTRYAYFTYHTGHSYGFDGLLHVGREPYPYSSREYGGVRASSLSQLFHLKAYKSPLSLDTDTARRQVVGILREVQAWAEQEGWEVLVSCEKCHNQGRCGVVCKYPEDCLSCEARHYVCQSCNGLGAIPLADEIARLENS